MFVVSGTERVAASRYRVYQYLPYFKKNSVKCEVFSITSELVTRIAIRSPEFNEILKLGYYLLLFAERFFRFWVIFFKATHFDILFLQRATFPFGLGKLLKMRNKNIVFDIDDAIFLPDTQKQGMVARCKRFVKEREVNDILRIARCVIVENDYIRDYVSKYCDKTYKIPGPIDTERYFVKEKEKGKNVILGWIGSPATTAYLYLLNTVFGEILSRFGNVKVVLIGAGEYEFSSDRFTRKSWNYSTEVKELQQFDIGLMPMPDDEWTKGKLGCKMLQYMAVGVPSVVSYTSTNAEIIKNGENGFLVKKGPEWVEKLALLIEKKELREKIGAAGRRTVEELCSVEMNAPRLLEILKSL